MRAPQFTEVPYLWDADGSLRDVYVLEASVPSWEKFLAFTSSFPCAYSFDGVAGSLPAITEIFANRNGSHLLSIAIGSVTANCHFFVASEIELDIDPKEVKGPDEHHQVLRFVEGLAAAMGKPAIVTPENSVEIPFLTYEPSSAAWSIHG